MAKRKRPEDKVKTGRPTNYTPELGERICNIIASNPYGLKKLAEMYEDIPHHQTVYEWLHKFSEFGDLYLIAKEKQARVVTEAMWEEADNLLPVAEEISRFTARFRFQQWHLSKLAPKQFGEKKQNESNVTVNIHEDQLKNLK